MKDLLKHLSIRSKLTIWYSILTVILLTLLIVLIYFPLQSNLWTNEENLIQLHATEVGIEFEGLSTEELQGQLGQLDNQGTFFAIYDSNNNLLVMDDHIDGSITALDRQFTGIRTVHVGEEDYMVFDQPVDDEGSVLLWLRAVRPLNSYEGTLRDFQELLVLILPLYLLIAIIGGIIVTKLALKPLTIMAKTAQEIGHGDLSTRLRKDLPNDEMGLLAYTFNDMLDRLENSFEKEKQFTSDASHELKTPIAIISAHAENALSSMNDPDEVMSSLDIILSETRSMTKTVSQLLTLTRSDHNNKHIHFERLNLSHILEDCLSIYEEEVDEIGYRLSASIPPDVTIMGDQTLMTRLFVNLIENAIKYGREGNHIQVQMTQNQSSIQIHVTDTGIGISQDDLVHIFDPFYRSIEARSMEGSGLGLALVQKIVHLHKGHMEVESTLGKGTTFTISFPLS